MIDQFIRYPRRALAVAALAALPALALAADEAAAPQPTPQTAQQADWQRRLEQAAAMQADGAARKAEASRLRADKQAMCARKFLVNACRNEAHQEYVTANREALRIESEGKALERQVHQEQLAEKDRQRALEAPRRDEDLHKRQAEITAEQQAQAAKKAAAQAEKAEKAERGAKRKALEAERQQRRQAEHDARVAEKKRAAEQRSREGEGQH